MGDAGVLDRGLPLLIASLSVLDPAAVGMFCCSNTRSRAIDPYSRSSPAPQANVPCFEDGTNCAPTVGRARYTDPGRIRVPAGLLAAARKGTREGVARVVTPLLSEAAEL